MNRREHMLSAACAAALVAMLGSPKPAAAAIKPDEARAIAKDAYIYGYPIVESYRILHSYFVDRSNPEYKAAWNEKVANNARLFTPADVAMGTPNADTPYSQLGLDLRAEPMVVNVPTVPKERYYSVEVNDLYTFIAGYLGTRAMGNEAAHFLIAGPNWKGERPQGIKSVIRTETQLAFLLFRTQLFRPEDIENVKLVQAGYGVQPLSKFLGKSAPSPAPRIDFVKPLSSAEQRTSLEFFNQLNFVLQFCPTHPTEKALMSRFGKLNIGAGENFDASALTPEIRQAIEDGRADAWREHDEIMRRVTMGEISSADVLGSRQALKNNYLYRMHGAVAGIWGNSKEEAIYPGWYTDSGGRALDGSKGRYQVRFDAGQLPPVNAFWSLTMYGTPSYLLVANPLNRYLINSPMLPDLKQDADGGLTIHVQYASPGKDRESNWLPAPNGPFALVLRMYWPKAEALNGTWKKPPLVRTN
ncbi:MAG TPA: DUF1254 domain-containing protein [Steroidobacteraceae bacterium]|nr:DUF1254 domain-containing protein [Steroidobacteraceae bacterium]